MSESNEDQSLESDQGSTADGSATIILESNGAIAALVTKTPCVDPEKIESDDREDSQRTRRRSSVSIIQAIASTGHLLTTKEARKRNFLVGASRQAPENVANDINMYFPNGRLLTIMMVTWNTGEASQLYEQNYTPTARETAQPKEQMLEDISDILLPTFIDYVADLIIVSTQEMSTIKKRMDWEILLQEVIGPTHVLFHSIHFGTLSLCIFLRRDLIWFCTEPVENIIKFRAVNPRRTKGSLIISFNLFGTSFMIINSHFEAGHRPEDRSNRRLNFQNTIMKLSLSPHAQSLSRQESMPSLAAVSRALIDKSKSCDCVLWGGDMNFRVDMSHDEVLKFCENEQYNEILAHDEFRSMQKKHGDLYSEFKEADIHFPPTYKYDLRAAVDVYAKHRTPSYTDRILYRDKPGSAIECTQYKAVQGVKHSDHKPVWAHFRVKLKPGLHGGNLSYGKFNHEVYKRGCKQRESHHSLGIDLNPPATRRGAAMPRSAVCVLQ